MGGVLGERTIETYLRSPILNAVLLIAFGVLLVAGLVALSLAAIVLATTRVVTARSLNRMATDVDAARAAPRVVAASGLEPST